MATFLQTLKETFADPGEDLKMRWIDLTGNAITIRPVKGHKRIESTIKYTHLVCFENDEYDVATATTLEEDQELLKTGFEYITERNGINSTENPRSSPSVNG